jgi:hypothetical protein
MKQLPRWWALLEELVPCAPGTEVHVYRCGEQPVCYHIGGVGWVDGGRDAKMYRTRLAAIIATWEWWLT